MLFNRKKEKTPKIKGKKNKKEVAPKVTLWVVIDNEYPDVPVTFTATHQDAVTALDQYLYLIHYAHFRLWCENHNLPLNHGSSWVEYGHTVINNEWSEGDAPKYSILRVNYDANIVAALFRNHNRCVPMGCPFDTDEELDDYSTYYEEKSKRVERGEDQFSLLEQAMATLFDDLRRQEREAFVKRFNNNNGQPNSKGGTRNDA